MAKIAYLPNQQLSVLLPWSSLLLLLFIICIVFVVYVAERWVFAVVYPRLYADLSSSARRRKGFVYNHVGIFWKICMFAAGVDPAVRIMLGSETNFDTPVSPGGDVTLGDVALIIMQMFCAYYAWELSYRAAQASYINLAHHVGVLVIGQVAVGLCADWRSHPEAIIEFYLCIAWGVFDVLTELPVSSALIYRRLRPEKHNQHSLIFRGIACTCVFSTLAEAAVTGHLLQASWTRWSNEWRVATPLVFGVWCAAQGVSAYQIWGIGRAEARKAAQREVLLDGSRKSSVSTSPTLSNAPEVKKEGQVSVCVCAACTV